METKIMPILTNEQLIGVMYLELLNLYDYLEENPTDIDTSNKISLLEKLIDIYTK